GRERVQLRDAGEQRPAGAEDDGDGREGQLVDEPRLERVAKEDAAVEIDVALPRLAAGRVDQLGDGAADGPYAGTRGIERARGRHQDGELAVGPLALEAADHVVGAAPHEHRADLGEEGRERVLDALAVAGEPVELVVRTGDEPVE